MKISTDEVIKEWHAVVFSRNIGYSSGDIYDLYNKTIESGLIIVDTKINLSTDPNSTDPALLYSIDPIYNMIAKYVSSGELKKHVFTNIVALELLYYPPANFSEDKVLQFKYIQNSLDVFIKISQGIPTGSFKMLRRKAIEFAKVITEAPDTDEFDIVLRSRINLIDAFITSLLKMDIGTKEDVRNFLYNINIGGIVDYIFEYAFHARSYSNRFGPSTTPEAFLLSHNIQALVSTMYDDRGDPLIDYNLRQLFNKEQKVYSNLGIKITKDLSITNVIRKHFYPSNNEVTLDNCEISKNTFSEEMAQLTTEMITILYNRTLSPATAKGRLLKWVDDVYLKLLWFRDTNK